MLSLTTITLRTALLAPVAATMPACVDGDVIFTSSHGGEESGLQPDHDSSSGPEPEPGATSTTGSSTTDDTAGGSSAGEPLGCFESELGDFDLVFSGCCGSTIGTCTDWCAQQSLGPCVFVGIYATSACADEVMYGGLCDIDPWVYFENDPPVGIQCVCGAA